MPFIAATLALLLLSARPAFAGDRTCANLATASANDLLAIPVIGLDQPPGVVCKSEGLGPASPACRQRVSIVQDQMIGHARRLFVIRYPSSGKVPLDEVLVLGCLAGQIKPVLNFSPPDNQTVKVTSAAPNKLVLATVPPGPGAQPSTHDFTWDTGDASDYASTISCRDLKTAKANRLIVLANGDLTRADAGYPFTHGTGCYDDPDDCEWKVDLDDDRMIGTNRRLLVLDSEPQGGGVGRDYGFIYIFGCISGQIHSVFSAEFYDGVSVQSISGDQLTLSISESTEKDPQCCPSLAVLKTYVWKAALQNYILESEDYQPASDGN